MRERKRHIHGDDIWNSGSNNVRPSLDGQDTWANELFIFCLKMILFVFIMSVLLGRLSQANCRGHVSLLNTNSISITVKWWEWAQGWDRALKVKYTVLNRLIQIVWERGHENSTWRSASKYNSINLYMHTLVSSYLTTKSIFQNIKNFNLLSWPSKWVQKEWSNLCSNHGWKLFLEFLKLDRCKEIGSKRENETSKLCQDKGEDSQLRERSSLSFILRLPCHCYDP